MVRFVRAISSAPVRVARFSCRECSAVMALADVSSTAAKVRARYERFPYPRRDPAEEIGSLRSTAPDHLAG